MPAIGAEKVESGDKLGFVPSFDRHLPKTGVTLIVSDDVEQSAIR